MALERGRAQTPTRLPRLLGWGLAIEGARSQCRDVITDVFSGHLWQSNDRHSRPFVTSSGSVGCRWLMIYSNVPQDCSSKRQATSRRCLSASCYILVSSPGRHFSAACLSSCQCPVPFLPFADPYHSKHRGVPDTPFACPSFWSSSTRTSRLVIRGVISCHVLILPCPEGTVVLWCSLMHTSRQRPQPRPSQWPQSRRR